MDNKKEIIRGLVFSLVKRHISGTTMDAVLNTVRQLNSKGVRTTVSLLNDHVLSQAKAKYNANAYIQCIRQISRLNLNSDVSLRLGQLGHFLGNGASMENLIGVAEAAKESNLHIWIESEERIPMEELLSTYHELQQSYGNVGVELSPMHIETATNKVPSLIRPDDIIKIVHPIETPKNGDMVKHERDKAKIYASCIDALITAKARIHLLEKSDKVIAKVAATGKGRELRYETFLGYGVGRFNKLARNKQSVGVYVPYGKDWIPYFIDKLAEGRVRKLAVALLSNSQDDSGGLDG